MNQYNISRRKFLATASMATAANVVAQGEGLILGPGAAMQGGSPDAAWL